MNRRRLALRVLLLALVAILAAGCYLAITHQEPRLAGGSPGMTDPPR